MNRKIFVYIFTLLILVCSLSLEAFAYNGEYLYNDSLYSTRQFQMTITRPDGNESTFRRYYVICGVINRNINPRDIRVSLFNYNYNSRRYVPLYDSDGYHNWDVGGSGIYMREIYLPNYGDNKIMVVAHKKSEDYNLVAGRNLQVNKFIVTLLSQSLKGSIGNGISTVMDMINRFFAF